MPAIRLVMWVRNKKKETTDERLLFPIDPIAFYFVVHCGSQPEHQPSRSPTNVITRRRTRKFDQVQNWQLPRADKC